jgi:hypothetical protein
MQLSIIGAAGAVGGSLATHLLRGMTEDEAL